MFRDFDVVRAGEDYFVVIGHTTTPEAAPCVPLAVVPLRSDVVVTDSDDVAAMGLPRKAWVIRLAAVAPLQAGEVIGRCPSALQVRIGVTARRSADARVFEQRYRIGGPERPLAPGCRMTKRYGGAA